jgi:hypothetical protein
MRSILLSAAVSIVIAASVANPARAAALAFDSAADPAYAPYLDTGAPIDGINGGYGWGPWEEYAPGFPSTSPYNKLYTSTSGSDWSQSPLTSSGTVWRIRGLPDGAEFFPWVVRSFDGSLAVGQTLSFDFEGVPTIAILSSDGTGAAYEINPGNQGWVNFVHTPSTVQFKTNLPLAVGADHFSITPIDSDHAIVSVTLYGPHGGTESSEMPYADVDGVEFQANGGDSPGFVNNLSITPEPGATALIAAAGLGLLLRRSRKRRSLIRRAPRTWRYAS